MVESTRGRLNITVAKIQQGLPELKRDGNTVVNAVYAESLWTSGSASQASGLMKQIEFNPILSGRLKTDPDSVVADLKELREYCSFVLVRVLYLLLIG